MLQLPLVLPLVFVVATIGSIGMLLYMLQPVVSYKYLLIIVTLLLAWMILQSLLALNQFYLAFESTPPRFLMAVLPAFIAILLVFLLPSRNIVLQLSLQSLTLLHSVRILVELGLWWLHNVGYVPQLMTFEGGNLDIISGITAVFVGVWAFQGQIKRRLLLTWNIIALLLLLNIVVRAALSLPYPTQQLAFEQPNTGVLYFPFIWLPSGIVPIVLFCHIASIGQLVRRSPRVG